MPTVRLKGDDGYDYEVHVDPWNEWVFRRWTWRVNTFGYVYRSTKTGSRRDGTRKSSNVYLHRVFKGLDIGDALQVDHLDADTLDNCESRLEVVSREENQRRRIERQRRGWTDAPTPSGET